MFVRAAVSLLLLAGLAADPQKLSHSYAKGDKSSYTIKLDVVDQAAIEADLDLEVASVEEKHVMVKTKASKVSITMQGGAPQNSEEDFGSIKVEKAGMPIGVKANDVNAAPLVLFMMGYLPASEWEVGKAVELKWKDSESGELSGTMTLDKVEERDGKKVALFSTKREFTPKEENSPGTITGTLEFDCDSGQLLKAAASLSIEQTDIKITIKKKG